jgi:hypothetical protein
LDLDNSGHEADESYCSAGKSVHFLNVRGGNDAICRERGPLIRVIENKMGLSVAMSDVCLGSHQLQSAYCRGGRMTAT